MKKYKIIIVYPKFFDEYGKNLTIGGIQTYILNLSKYLNENGFTIFILQLGKDFIQLQKDFFSLVIFKKKIHLKQYIEDNFSDNTNIIIFASENFYFNVTNSKTICIQHGVYWDIPIQSKLKFFIKIIQLNRVKRALSKIKKIKYMVHVDFNLINNLHTYGFFPDKSIFINNFSSFELNKHEIDEKSKSWKNKQKLKLLFPRRLQIIRGTRILPSVVKYLEEKKIDYQLTICGEGPDVSFLESQFKNNVRIKLIIGESENEMKRIYSDHDVVLVPSIASEGTSISAIEGMATGCVVLASEVGGLSNIIIDNYNGIICSSNNHLTFAHAIEKLLQNKSFAVELIEQAYKVYKTSFTKELWQNKWMEVIKNHKSINQLEL